MAFKGKIYYVTRTWGDKEKADSCARLRIHYADVLQKEWPVVIVTPNYTSEETILRKNMISFPYPQSRMKWDLRMQKLRLREDYLDGWAKITSQYLAEIVTEQDVVYAISGGEIGCIKIGIYLKQQIGCRIIINFHDPVDGDVLFNKMLSGYHGLPRTDIIRRNVEQADLIITSSETYQDILQNRFPQMSNKITNHYFGYMEEMHPRELKEHHIPLNVVYAGATSKIQGADILYKALLGRNDVTVTYICADYAERKKKMPEHNVQCLPLMPYKQFRKYMLEVADIGFLPLKGAYAGACVPSKLYEYLNIGIPILASLPEGSAKRIVQDNGYGVVCRDGDIEGLRAGFEKMIPQENYLKFARAVRRDRKKWSSAFLEQTYLQKLHMFFDTYYE